MHQGDNQVAGLALQVSPLIPLPLHSQVPSRVLKHTGGLRQESAVFYEAALTSIKEQYRLPSLLSALSSQKVT